MPRASRRAALPLRSAGVPNVDCPGPVHACRMVSPDDFAKPATARDPPPRQIGHGAKPADFAKPTTARNPPISRNRRGHPHALRGRQPGAGPGIRFREHHLPCGLQETSRNRDLEAGTAGHRRRPPLGRCDFAKSPLPCGLPDHFAKPRPRSRGRGAPAKTPARPMRFREVFPPLRPAGPLRETGTSEPGPRGTGEDPRSADAISRSLRSPAACRTTSRNRDLARGRGTGCGRKPGFAK